MRRIVLSPAAVADLTHIWDFTAERWDVEQADEYLREIERALGRVADNPLIGRACDEIRSGYRRHSVGSHSLYYRYTGDDVDIVRVLHHRMDVDRALD